MLDRFLRYQPLKDLARTGWVRNKVENPETVAGHVWGVAVLVMELQPTLAPNIDLLKALKMALHHDTPEILTGDVTPHCNISREEKAKQEAAAAERLLAPWAVELWHERERADTAEGKFVKAMDLLDMALQALEYWQKGRLEPPAAQAFVRYCEERWPELGYPQLGEEIAALVQKRGMR